MEPVPTGEVPVLKRLTGIRAVLFDVYGTLFVSGSGEVGTAGQPAADHSCGAATTPMERCPADAARQRPLDEALQAMGVPTSAPADQGVECLRELIEASHARSRSSGIDYPEVDIVELWREVLAELARCRVIEEADARAADPKRLAVEYEVRTNPCWPMPHLPECLDWLRQGGLVLGLVSNAQFYTPELIEALLGKPAEQWGFPADLQYYSYQYGRAKPGLALFERALAALADRRIAPGGALYVGNDVLNDLLPASKLGLRTALFAGDARSLRRREDRPQLEAAAPDLILTDLMELAQCIMI
jgi:putative hydrolase of the HAD superfamily